MALTGCCGCNLRTSALAIGTFFLVNNLIHVLAIAISWSKYSASTQAFYDPDVPTEIQERMKTYERLIFIPQMIYALSCLVFNGLLIYGAKRRSPWAVYAWLVFYAIVFALFTLTAIGLLIACGFMHAGYITVQTAGGLTGGNYAHGNGTNYVNSHAQGNMTNHSNSEVDKMIWMSENLNDALVLAFGVSGALGLFLSCLLWYWYALMRALYRALRAMEGANAEMAQSGPVAT